MVTEATCCIENHCKYSFVVQNNKSRMGLLELVIAYYLIIILSDTAFTQFQLSVFGGIVLDAAVIPSLAIIGTCAAFLIEALRIKTIKKRYLLIVFFFCAFSATEVVYYFTNGAEIFYTALFLYNKVIPLLLVFTIILSKRQIKYKFLINGFKIFAFCNAILTIVQFVTNDLIWLYTVDNLGNELFWSIYSTDFSRLRPPGCMNSALTSGYISVIWFGLILYNIYHRKKKIKKQSWISASVAYVSIIIAFAAILVTQTRNVYFTLAFIILYFFIANIAKKNSRIIMPSFTVLAVILYFVLFLYVLPALEDVNGVFSTASSLIRLRNWLNLWEKVERENVMQILFGTMEWQSVAPTSVFSDNLFMDTFFSMGAIGIIIYLIINVKLQRWLLSDKPCYAIAALAASILFVGVANVPSSCYESSVLIISAVFIHNLERGVGVC